MTSADGPVAVTGGKERALLAVLVMSAGEVVTTDRLIDAVWGESPPRSHLKVLQNLVWRLRKTLGPGLIESTPGGYVLGVAPDAVDAHRVDGLARLARQRTTDNEPAAAVTALAAAAQLWRGTPLVELGDWPPALGERARLEEQQRTVSEQWAEAELCCGNHRQWVAELERMVLEEPLREQRWALLMLALYRCGQQADALRAFQRARAALTDVGLDPGPTLRTLEHDISTHALPLTPDNSPPATPTPTAMAEAAGLSLRGLRSEVVAEPSPAMEGLIDSGDEGVVPATFATRRSNLPVPADSFVGRAGDVDGLGRLLVAHRLVTIVGTGGIGKTRLALEVVSAMDGYPGGMWFVALGSVREAGDVEGTVAAALGIRLSSGVGITEQIAEWCSRQQALIILDNCEHVVEGAARLVAAVLDRGSKTTLLATSREPLALTGEHLFPLGPLGLAADGDAESESVRLLLDRAIADRPDIAATLDRAVLAKICTRLDGLPLAIELAAARLRVLTPAAIAEGLDHRFRLLTGGRRMVDDRQRTLRATIDWSYNLLTEPQRRLFERLGVFAGPFGLDDVMAIDADEPGSTGADDPLDILAGLVDRSLVTVADTEPPYQMLESLRSYAVDRLRERGRDDDVRSVHARWFHTKAIRASVDSCGPAHQRIQHLLRSQRAEYTTATAWAIDHDEVDLGVGIVTTLQETRSSVTMERVTVWAVPLLAGAASASPVTLARMNWLFGCHHQNVTGDLAAADEALTAAIRLDPTFAFPHVNRAIVAFLTGNTDEVLPFALQALHRAGDDPAPRAMGYMLAGHAHLVVGHTNDAQAIGIEFLKWARGLDWPHAVGSALHLLGRIDTDLNPDRAMGAFEEALTIARQIESPVLEVIVRREMVSLLIDRYPGAAMSEVTHVLRRCREINDIIDAGGALVHAAVVLARLDHPDVAAMLFGKLGAGLITATDLQRRERTMRDLERSLGARYHELTAEGAALTTSKLLDLTITELDDCAARAQLPSAPR